MTGGPADELVEGGYALEIADAPLLHRGLTLADLAHVLTLLHAGVIPPEPARALLGVLLEALEVAPEDFPYDPAYGEVYSSRERHFADRIGTAAGWLHAGRTRREAMRIAFRLQLRSVLTDLIAAAAGLVADLARLAASHTETWMPDQTYLQHAQPTTFGHYVLSFAHPVLRDGHRLTAELDGVDASPGGTGSGNGTALLPDRTPVADRLGFDSVIDHTRDAMWQTDGLVAALAAGASLLVTQSTLAEDLEIYASQEYGWVSLGDGYSRSSVLLPQKRNPYALTMIRGAAGVAIGRLTGMLAVTKTPSARSDNLIFAYGEVPRALAAAARTTRLTAGVVRTLSVDAGRLWTALEGGVAQAGDLAEYVMLHCGVDYRSAHRVVGVAVRAALDRGLRGVDLDPDALDAAAVEVLGHPLGLDAAQLRHALDPREIVHSRTCRGGAAPEEVARMAAGCVSEGSSLADAARARARRHRIAEQALVAAAREVTC
ncbi:MAG: argininosuccinate lyase [Pseudonocardiaceae bacterium]|nr:argininosuccinate lyase [Pseudonocardiaceae bacterium]